MRFLFAVMAPAKGPVAAVAGEMQAIDAFNDKIEQAGQRLMAVGIAGPETAFVVDNRQGAGEVTPGPAVEADLFMAGFWVIEAESDAAARTLAIEASQACNRLIEIRRIL